MVPAHCLTERNICVKFNEIQSKGSGYMERTQKCYRQTDDQTKAIPLTPSASQLGIGNGKFHFIRGQLI